MRAEPAPAPRGLTRRRVLITGTALAAGATISACAPAGSATASATGPSTVATADVPVGGGLVLPERTVVITQPTAGQFKAFSALCSHEGCVVTSVSEGAIICPCHNGLFSAIDGTVMAGPPPTGLAEIAITVSGATITVP